MIRHVTIVNKLGLHARASAKFIQEAKKYACTVEIGPDQDHLVNGKSMIHIMTLAAARGTKLVLKTEGEDAELALEKLNNLIESRFGEDE